MWYILGSGKVKGSIREKYNIRGRTSKHQRWSKFYITTILKKKKNQFQQFTYLSLNISWTKIPMPLLMHFVSLKVYGLLYNSSGIQIISYLFYLKDFSP